MGKDKDNKEKKPGLMDRIFHRGSSKKDDKKPSNQIGPLVLKQPSSGDQTPKVPSQPAAKLLTPEEAKKTTSEIKHEEYQKQVKAQRDQQANFALMAANRVRGKRGEAPLAAPKKGPTPEEQKLAEEKAAKERALNEKKKKFEEKHSFMNKTLTAVLVNSNQILNSNITHRAMDAVEIADQKRNLGVAQVYYNALSTYSELAEDQNYGYTNKLWAMQKKQEAATQLVAQAEEKVEKYREIREDFTKEINNKRLMKFVKKVSELENPPKPDPNKKDPVNPQPTAPAEQTESDEKLNEQIEEFYGEHMDTWVSAADDIQGLVMDHFDTNDLGSVDFGTKADKANAGLGGIFGIFGAIKSVFEAWNHFSKLHREDKEVKAKGITLDAADKWQRVREGLEKVVEVITSTMGAVGSFLNEGPAAILGLISNCAVLLLKFITIADSTARSGGILKRKQKLWNKMAEKREKYKDDPVLVNALNMSGWHTRASLVKKKRDFLRDYLTTLQLGSANNEAVAKKKALDPSKKYKKVKESYGEDYTNLSDKIDAEKSWAKEQGIKGKYGEERKKYEHRIHMMEALELVERYYEEDAAHDRHLKMIGHAVEDSITESIDMIGNIGGLTVVGSWAGILSKAAAVYSIVRGVGSKVYSWVSEKNGHNNDKAFRRTEMSQTMFQTIKGITTAQYGWDGETFQADEMENFRLESANDRLDHIHGMITGLDLHMNPLLLADSKDAFIENLASAFSQDGNG